MTLRSDTRFGAWNCSPKDNLTHTFSVVECDVQEQTFIRFLYFSLFIARFVPKTHFIILINILREISFEFF